MMRSGPVSQSHLCFFSGATWAGFCSSRLPEVVLSPLWQPIIALQQAGDFRWVAYSSLAQPCHDATPPPSAPQRIAMSLDYWRGEGGRDLASDRSLAIMHNVLDFYSTCSKLLRDVTK